jgi:perosamine synthetase
MLESLRKTIPVARPWMDSREVDAVRRPIENGWITQGPEVAAFEKEFGEYVGAPYACAVSNCTAALHLALLACGVSAGDEVITVSHSFIATASSIRYCGAIPVFVDILPDTFNLDPSKIENAISPKTKAILCVHQMGMPCDLTAILQVAHKHQLPVVEDAACAVGSEILWNGEWQRIGKPHGDIACFSFHPRKLLTTGDGGMLTTANQQFDAKFRLWRQHGMSIPDTVRHSANQVIFEEYPEVGFNYRLTDIQAAVGREQLRKLPELISRRRKVANRYAALLRTIPGVTTPEEPHWAHSNWQSYSIRLPEGSNQLAVMQHMLDQGVATRRGIMCSHRERAYANHPWRCAGDQHAEHKTCACPASACLELRESETAQDHCVILPLFHDLTEEDQDRIVSVLRASLASA